MWFNFQFFTVWIKNAVNKMSTLYVYASTKLISLGYQLRQIGKVADVDLFEKRNYCSWFNQQTDFAQIICWISNHSGIPDFTSCLDDFRHECSFELKELFWSYEDMGYFLCTDVDSKNFFLPFDTYQHDHNTIFDMTEWLYITWTLQHLPHALCVV